MEFRILGPLEVLDDGRPLVIPPGHQRTLLLLLVVNANRVLTTDEIVDALWHEDLPATGTKALAYHVSRLRDALAPSRRPGDGARGGIETEASGYVLRVDPDAIDAVRFEREAYRARELLPEDPAAAGRLLDEALGLWRGSALVDVAYEEFAQDEIRRLEERRFAAREDRIEADLALGRNREAVAAAGELLRQQPLGDRVRVLLMLALYREGRQAEALRVAGEGRRLAAEELGVDPSPELVRIESWILQQDPRLDGPSLHGPAVAGRPARNPFKGLRPFTEADAADFYGRETLVRRLVDRVDEVARAGRLLLVVGPSGSGKSSVVRAGLVPVLRAGAAHGSDDWRLATMIPGSAPFRELAAALRGTGADLPADILADAEQRGDLGSLIAAALPGGTGRVLLVIDQLEELYTRGDEATRSGFLAALATELRRNDDLVVVATLRADFLDRPLRSPGIGQLVPGGIEVITPMTLDELERAISRPAAGVGVGLEPGLVAEMALEVERHPSMLPLLQYALTDLFDRSGGRELTRDGYAAIGGVTAALEHAADEAWIALDPAARGLARRVLLRFVVLSDGTQLATRRVARAELLTLSDPAAVDAILDELGRRRLLAFDRDADNGQAIVEVAHEALLTHWPRLAAWIDERRQDLWVRRRVDDAVAEWEAAGRSREFLASGARLDQFAAWAGDAAIGLTGAERAYIDAGLAERARVHRRRTHVRAAVAGTLLSAAIVACSLGVVLLGERQAAAQREAVTTARGLASGSVASLGKDPELSLLLALQAANATAAQGFVVEEAYDALHWALQEAGVGYPRAGALTAVRQGPDGPRGVFLLAPDALMRTAADYVGRSLFPAECLTYLHTTDCRAVEAPPVGEDPLGVRTGRGVVTAEALAVGSVTGTTVRVLSELPADVAPLLTEFRAGSGIDLSWVTPSGGLDAGLATGDLPDLAIVERPSLVASAGQAGSLLDLDGLVDADVLATDAGEYGLALGSTEMGGTTHRFGVPVAATLEDLLWYPEDAFALAGYSPPATPEELGALVARLRRDGRVPWCLGTQPDAGTEPGTSAGPATLAWVEDALLDREGPGAYDDWTAGRAPSYVEGADRPGAARSPAQAAIESLKARMGEPGAVYGGLAAAAWTPEELAILPMVVEGGPRCWLYRGASTDRPAFAARGGRVSAVPFPGASPGSHPALGRLYQLVVLRDRPEVREVAQALLERSFADAVSARLAADGILPVRDVPPPADTLAASQLARLRSAMEAGTFRVRAIDLFPAPVAASFRVAVGAYLADVKPVLPARLWEIDAAWRQSDPETEP
ncbi:MAG TPA: BTAD domain-containing putative transcriptional regulator [Candidatus Limnocylindrales bacterium]|nr:BTAD domain-containing putative transcriptional regulator [Candidatus Limnocylindrales bacterium]